MPCSRAYPSRKSMSSSGRLTMGFSAESFPTCYPGSTVGSEPGLPTSRWRADVPLGRHLILTHDANRAGHPVRAVVAVAAWVLVEVLLVVALGVVEGAGFLGGPCLGGDVAK